MTAIHGVAILATTMLGAIAVFQVLLAAGLPYGKAAWGGTHRVLPPKLRWASLASLVVLASMAWVVLARSGLVAPGAESAAIRVMIWVFAGFFALNTVGNLASKSVLERSVMTPATLLIVHCFVSVALSAPVP